MDFSKNKPLAGKIWLAVVMFITSGIMMSAQTLNVSGRVSDEKGEMLAGIAVYEKGTTNGTLTEITGGISKGTQVLVDFSLSGGTESPAGGQTSNPFMPRRPNNNRNNQQKK